MTTKEKCTFIFLLVTGLSGMATTLFTTRFQDKMNAIVPLPKVFVDEHYLYEKDVRIYYTSTDYLSYNLKNEKGWPFKKGLLIEFYSLLNSLDRPQLVKNDYWQNTVDHYFCKKSSYLKDEITSKNILKIQVFVRKPPAQWFLAKEHACSN